MEDPRKRGLKDGLRQLTAEQIEKVLSWPDDLVLDHCNYQDGKFCPLAVGVGLEKMPDPTHDKVYAELVRLGYKVYNTRGIKGDFYTTDRKADLIQAANEVLAEKRAGEELS